MFIRTTLVESLVGWVLVEFVELVELGFDSHYS